MSFYNHNRDNCVVHGAERFLEGIKCPDDIDGPTNLARTYHDLCPLDLECRFDHRLIDC